MHAYSAWVTPPLALFLGLAFALLCGQAHPKFNKKTSKYLLQYSVVGLGFGMNLQASLASGKEGMEFTIISVVGTLLIGWLIGRKFLKVDRDTSYLISSGTAICGGSAIAAVGPAVSYTHLVRQTSVIQHLQQDVEYVRMRFLDFVE